MKLLLETNVLIDFYAHRKPFFNEAEKLFFLGYAKEVFIVENCAERVGADFIITRDRRGFALLKLPVCSPSGFFECMETNHNIVYEITDL